MWGKKTATHLLHVVGVLSSCNVATNSLSTVTYWSPISHQPPLLLLLVKKKRTIKPLALFFRYVCNKSVLLQEIATASHSESNIENLTEFIYDQSNCQQSRCSVQQNCLLVTDTLVPLGVYCCCMLLRSFRATNLYTWLDLNRLNCCWVWWASLH